MTANVYEQHDKQFANVSAYAILQHGQAVASIAFRYPRDGAGRLYAYVHWLGGPMARGSATGGGYDKRSAAIYDANRRHSAEIARERPMRRMTVDEGRFWMALKDDDGWSWSQLLESAGFKVFQTV